MEKQLARQVRRVGVKDPIVAAHRYDYADAFEIQLPGPDPYSPEAWGRAGLAATPGWVDRVVGLLGFSEANGLRGALVGSLDIVDAEGERAELLCAGRTVRAESLEGPVDGLAPAAPGETAVRLKAWRFGSGGGSSRPGTIREFDRLLADEGARLREMTEGEGGGMLSV